MANRFGIPVLLAVAASLLAAPSRAAEFPGGTVRILVGFAAGGAPDLLARVVGDKLGALWGQPVVVENRVGAQGNIAMSAVARAAPDGTTLALAPVGNVAVAPALFADLPYDPVKDFAPITEIASVENVLVVSGKAPAGTLPDLLALGRAGGTPLTYGTPGAGSIPHLAAELLSRATGVAMTHVPYRGVTPALVDVMRGEVTLMFAQLSTAKPMIESGDLRALAVASRRRSPSLPNLPTVAEAASLPEFEGVSWYGLMAPARTPPATVARIRDDVARVLAMPEVAAALAAQGATPIGSTPAEFAAVIARDTERWGKVVRDAKIEAR